MTPVGDRGERRVAALPVSERRHPRAGGGGDRAVVAALRHTGSGVVPAKEVLVQLAGTGEEAAAPVGAREHVAERGDLLDVRLQGGVDAVGGGIHAVGMPADQVAHDGGGRTGIGAPTARLLAIRALHPEDHGVREQPGSSGAVGGPPTAQTNAQGDLAEGNESVGHSLATQLPLGAHKRGGEARTGTRQPVAVGLPQLPRRQRLRLVRESDGGRDAVAG